MEGQKHMVVLLDLAVRINEETEYQAWFNFSGHINSVEVYVKRHFSDEEYDKYFRIYLDWENHREKSHKAIAELKELLK